MDYNSLFYGIPYTHTLCIICPARKIIFLYVTRIFSVFHIGIIRYVHVDFYLTDCSKNHKQRNFITILFCKICSSLAMGGSRGGDRGSGPPLKNHKHLGFPSNTGPDPLKSYQARIQCRVINGMTTKRHLNGILLAGRWWPALSGIWIISPLLNLKKQRKSWTPSDKSFWIRACLQPQGHDFLVLITLPSNDGSDEPVHMGRLARAFAAGMIKVRM